MITLTLYNTTRHIYIDEKDVVRVTDGHDLVGNRSYPWSDIVITDIDGKEKTIRVVESARQIGKLMTEAIRKKGQSK